MNRNLRFKGVTGDLTGVYGDLSGVTGDLSGVYGDLSGVHGDLDRCGITQKDRSRGVNVAELLKEEVEK